MGMSTAETLLNIAQQSLEMAKAAGADAADAMIIDGRDLTLRHRMGKVESVERAESQGLGVRVLVGAKGGYRQAMISTTNTAPDAMRALIQQAVEMARIAPPDPYTDLAEAARLCRTIPDLQLEDTTEVSLEMLQGWAAEAEEAALAVKGITNSDGAEASTGSVGVALCTSHGFGGYYRGTTHGIAVGVIAGKDMAMETDYDDTGARFVSALRPAAEVGKTAGQRAVARLNPRKQGTQKLPVVYDARCARSLLGSFLNAINGASIARKTSFLLDALGKPVFPAHIRITDNPLVPRGMGSEPFDGEGIQGQPLSLVEQGILQSWILDTRSANQLGLRSTGHAGRSLSSAPSPASSNVTMEAGTLSVEALIADIKEGFFVTEAFGQGVNGITGDYSKGASGFWIENGKITYPVSEMTIAGNLKDMFMQLTPANDLEMSYALNCPSLRIEGMTVAGV